MSNIFPMKQNFTPKYLKELKQFLEIFKKFRFWLIFIIGQILCKSNGYAD